MRLNLTVQPDTPPTRLDLFLARHLPDLSRSQVQRLIKEGQATVDGKAVKPSHEVRVGERLVVELPDTPTAPTDIQAEEIPLTVLHEDDDLLVINKPRGMVVHPAAGNWSGTLVNALLGRGESFSSYGGADRPGIVHRLDKDTSGVMVIAKNDRAHRKLARQFGGRKVEKRYHALVCGVPKAEAGVIAAPLGRHPINRKKIVVLPSGREAVTEYRVQEAFPEFALLDVHPLTGRTHQIRVHLAHIGHPVVGDEVYGGRKRALHIAERWKDAELRRLLEVLSGQALHAASLSFNHPTGGRRMTFAAEMPMAIEALITRLRRRA